jgi:acetylornithine/succinyldiaminopimelate/putrescine aminotransferase/predicted amino acid dehydrogenase
MTCQIYRQSILQKFKLNLNLIRSKGCFLYDVDGRKILDGVSQFGAVPLGHNPDNLVRTLIDYCVAGGPNFVQPFIPETTRALAARLIELAGIEYSNVVFSNSGTETVEAALKLSRQKTGRKKILSANNSFHGKTFASLSATGSSKYSNPKIVDKENFDNVRFNNIEELEQALASKEYAAFIIEPVQGEGGMVPGFAGYLQQAERLCKATGTLLVLDEIQTGLGRTGELFAAHTAQIKPDLLLLSKALSGGLVPIGAMIVKRTAYDEEFDRKHSSTFANGGLASAVALEVIDTLTENNGFLLEHVRDCGDLLKTEFARLCEQYPDNFKVSGIGLMWALHFRDTKTEGNYLVNYAHKSDLLSLLICGYLVHAKGIFCMPLLNDAETGSVRFQPSLNTNKAELQRFLGAFSEICQLLAEQRYDTLMGYLVNHSPVLDNSGKEGRQAKKAKPIQLSPKPVKDGSFRFAFLMHSTSPEDICKGLPEKVKENFSHDEQLQLANWFFSIGEIEYSPEVVFEFSMSSKQGNTVNGAMIYSPVSPQSMLKMSQRAKKELLNDYLAKARETGATLVGLGAYTSVISKGGIELDAQDLAITTGNSLTAVSTCNAIRDLFGESIREKRLMIFGSRGSVGRLALLELSQYFSVVELVASPHSSPEQQYLNLAAVLSEIKEEVPLLDSASAAGKFWQMYQEIGTEHSLTYGSDEQIAELVRKVLETGERKGIDTFKLVTDFPKENNQIDCVFSATSEGKAFISAEQFKPDCRIFDVARPFDILNGGSDREVFEGGLVRLPDQRAMLSDSNIIGCRPGVNLACLSETIALSMEHVDQSYSVGKEIPYRQAKYVNQIAEKHGFRYYLKQELHNKTAL